MNNIIIDEQDSGKRIDCYLSNLLDNFSRSQIQSLIKKGGVKINHKLCKPSQIIKTDDTIIIETSLGDKTIIEPENIEINTIYENDFFAIINKPSGMLTHPTSTQKSHTLVNAILYKYKQLSNINGDFRAGIVHRLDKNTSGLLIIAKNNLAHEKLANMIKNREIEKHYRAITKGIISEDITINKPIARSKTNPTKMEISENGKPSITEVHPLKIYKENTYIDINLKTGRTHQIRVHLSSIGHPIFNDTLYGFGKQKIKTEEQVLQSYKLKFTNPFDGKIIQVEIEPDEKIKKILKYLETKEL